MSNTRELFDTMTAKAGLSSDVLANAVDTLQECEEVVTACAMGMLGEQDALHMASAISRDLDCADVAGTTRRILTRGSGPDNSLISAQVEACLLACERSHALCSQHAARHAHCQMCTDVTRRCADMCRQILGELRR
ncbi:four-helix bundle copper-binding protein [Streptosporangium sp. NPDC087985]|uniref:four-helix bundle copper-binding protein n=1 Tax=Streptosporangium sp. NPDC087985 TaxID=3366196 RepID=UPI00380DFE43